LFHKWISLLKKNISYISGFDSFLPFRWGKTGMLQNKAIQAVFLFIKIWRFSKDKFTFRFISSAQFSSFKLMQIVWFYLQKHQRCHFSNHWQISFALVTSLCLPPHYYTCLLKTIVYSLLTVQFQFNVFMSMADKEYHLLEVLRKLLR